MNNYNSYEVGNLLNAISILLGYQNLQENRRQSEYNDIHKANDEQAEMLLNEINDRFNELKTIVYEQNKKIEVLIELLGGKNDL